MSSNSHTLPGAGANEALDEEFGWRGRWPVLLLGAASFGFSGPAWSLHPAWPLALGLWLGYCLAHGLAGLLSRLLRPQRWSVALGLLLAALLGGALSGWRLEQALQSGTQVADTPQVRLLLHLAFVGLLLLPPLAQAALRRRALRKLEAERARVQAELQLLQAQIEPHFLFNTLATLRSLVRQQSSDALPLLDRMTAFLQAVLPEVRTPLSSLGRELTIVEQYLAIMALRMGPRLRYRIEATSALRALPLPPLLLQPLVENALLHGIEPNETGGEILLQAHAEGGELRLLVANGGAPLTTGSTPAAAAGHGLALRNLEQRLHALYGGHAHFSLRPGTQGTEAWLCLPLDAGAGIP